MQNYRQGQQIVIGNYKLLIMKLLGQGSFGFVYQVCDWVNQKQIYALKIQDGMSDQEAQITQIIRDKNPKGIVKIYEFIKQNNSYLILMEYLPNNLYEVITTQVISEIQLRYIFKQLAETLQSLHDLNIAHRDLKPENILVENIGEQRNQLTFKLCDFGISKIETQELFKTINIGTPYYQAPEQLDNNVCFDKSVDIWALGAICYEMITKKPLFNGHSIQQVQSLIKDRNYSIQQINKLSIHQDFKDLILRMVEFDVSKRITLDLLIQKLKPRVERSPISVQQQIQTLQRPSSQRQQNIQYSNKNDNTQKNDTVLLSKSPIIVPQQIQVLLKPSSQRQQNVYQPQKNDNAQKNDIVLQFNNQMSNSDKKKAPQEIVQINQIKSNLNPASHNGTIQVFQIGKAINQPNINNQQVQNYYQQRNQQNNFNNKQEANQQEEKQSNIQSGHNYKDGIPLNKNQKINSVPSQNAQTVQIQKQNQPLNAIPYVNEKNILNNQQSTQEQIKQYNHVENQDVKNVTPPQKQDSIKQQNNEIQIQRFFVPQQDQQKYNDIIKIVPKYQNLNNQSNKAQQLNAGSPLGTRQSRAELHQQNSPKKVNQQQNDEQNIHMPKKQENSEIQQQVQPIIFQSQYQNQNQNQNQNQSIQTQITKSLFDPMNQETHLENNNIKQIRNINNPIPQTALKLPFQRVGQSQPPVNNQLNTIQPPINSQQQQNIQTNQSKIPLNYFGQHQIGNNPAVVQQIPPNQGKIPNQSNVGQVQAIADMLPLPSDISKGIDIKPTDMKFKQDDRPNSQNQSNKIQFYQNPQPIVKVGVPYAKKG